MPRLKAGNNAQSTLVNAMTTTDTTIVVQSAALFPSAPFRITIDAEIMEVGVINKGTNTFSNVTRGLEGTNAAAHSAGAYVENRLTAGTYDELLDSSALNGKKFYRQSTAPAIGSGNAQLGDEWIDTSTNRIKQCNGMVWVDPLKYA